NITVGNFRLANIDIPIGGGYTGRAEFYNKTTQLWGTICDDNWFNSYNPKVFCNSLSLPKNYASFFSFNTVSGAPSSNKWRVSGAINMDNVSCATGQESSLFECSYDYRNDCSHGEDVIVTC
ncbi:MAG: scavenger receptor cysteine-rich domain-containing protein, partial [bacterium]